MNEQNLSQVPSFPLEAMELANAMAAGLLDKGLIITTAESCTAGLLAAAITELAGSSAWFEQGVVTYSNQAKESLLDVPSDILREHGAVSEACVCAMAEGAVRRSGANVGVSISGIAGPDGATADKPVGTVWIGWSVLAGDMSVNANAGYGSGALHRPVGMRSDAECFHFEGDRRKVREQAVLAALRGTISRLN